MNVKKLENKLALVTGGSQGIGGEITKELLGAGCSVAVHYHHDTQNNDALKKFAEECKCRIGFFQADLTNEKEAAECVNAAAGFLGGLDILVNNAGGLIARKNIESMDKEFWQTVIDVNLTSMMVVTREAVKYLAKSGGSSIINIASLAGRKGGHPGSLAYSTQKGAVLTWTRALATELAPRGIRVNAVAPGFILGTKFHATFTTEQSARETIAAIPLKRAGNPNDVARAVCFLASEYDGFITGATLDINGGAYMI